MSLLERSVTLQGINGRATVVGLFDSGASYSCIRRELAEEVGLLEPLEEPMVFDTADENTAVQAEYVVHLSFYFPDTKRRFTDEFIVLESLSEPLIFGAKTMQAWNIRLDFANECVLYDRKVHKLRL